MVRKEPLLLLFTLPFLSRCLKAFEKPGEDAKSNNKEEKEESGTNIKVVNWHLMLKVIIDINATHYAKSGEG